MATTDAATGHAAANTAQGRATDRATTDRATVCELVVDLVVIEHRLRDLRRWTLPDGTTVHLDAALTSVAAALDSLHAEHQTRSPS